MSDAFAVFQVACAEDAEDAFSKPTTAGTPCKVETPTTVGVPDPASRIFFGNDAQAASYQGSLDHLTSLGAKVIELDFSPFYAVAEMLYHGTWVAERYTVVEELMRETPEALHPTTAEVIGVA